MTRVSSLKRLKNLVEKAHMSSPKPRFDVLIHLICEAIVAAEHAAEADEAVGAALENMLHAMHASDYLKGLGYE